MMYKMFHVKHSEKLDANILQKIPKTGRKYKKIVVFYYYVIAIWRKLI